MSFFKKNSTYCWGFFNKAVSIFFFVMVHINAGLYIIQLMRELLLSISNSGEKIREDQTSLVVPALHELFPIPAPKYNQLLN